MLFYSPHANFQVICSKTRIIRHPVSGEEIDRVPGIWANFGQLGQSYTFTNPETGEEMHGAEISGHFYDTDVEAVQNGWDPETKEMVEAKLLRLCQQQPDRIQRREREIPKTEIPWPTYDTTPLDKVLEVAPVAGVVAQALAYEQENRNRPAFVDGLKALLAQDAVDEDVDEPEAAPVAVTEPAVPVGAKPGEPEAAPVAVTEPAVPVGAKPGEPVLGTISL